MLHLFALSTWDYIYVEDLPLVEFMYLVFTGLPWVTQVFVVFMWQLLSTLLNSFVCCLLCQCLCKRSTFCFAFNISSGCSHTDSGLRSLPVKNRKKLVHDVFNTLFFFLFLFFYFLVLLCLLQKTQVSLAGNYVTFRALRVFSPSSRHLLKHSSCKSSATHFWLCSIFLCPNNGMAVSVWDF